MRLLVRSSLKGESVSTAWLKQVASIVLTQTKGKEFEKKSELSIVLTGDLEVRKLNKLYRGKNRTTDVLSFPLLEGKRLMAGSELYLPLGDVVISVAQTKRQASEHGKDFRQELALLLMHGILHLLGYDHATPVQKKRMFGLQDKILRGFEP